jgi:cytoskeletal protein CcmA (bactofilin family)
MGKDSTAGQRAGGEPAVLGRGLTVVGRVRGEGDLRVEAQVEGDITVSGQLHLAAPGRVSGSVSGETIVVSGLLEGDATARAAVSIEAEGRVRGDIHAPELRLDEGGGLEGRIEAEFDLPDELA